MKRGRKRKKERMDNALDTLLCCPSTPQEESDKFTGIHDFLGETTLAAKNETSDKCNVLRA
jgi:hypothetical protein